MLTGTKHSANRVRQTLKLAAMTLRQSQSALDALYRLALCNSMSTGHPGKIKHLAAVLCSARLCTVSTLGNPAISGSEPLQLCVDLGVESGTVPSFRGLTVAQRKGPVARCWRHHGMRLQADIRIGSRVPDRRAATRRAADAEYVIQASATERPVSLAVAGGGRPVADIQCHEIRACHRSLGMRTRFLQFCPTQSACRPHPPPAREPVAVCAKPTAPRCPWGLPC